jgi:hypothetical protein
MQKKSLLTKQEPIKKTLGRPKNPPKVKLPREKFIPVFTQEIYKEKAKVAAGFSDSSHSFKQPYKEQDLVILLDALTGSELLVQIQKITNQEEVYVKHHKGKHSSRREQWLVGIDSIERLATPQEIRAAELRG